MNDVTRRTWLGLKGAAVLSGAAALIAETLWIRSLSLMVGSTVEAASALFAALLVGLALGAWLAGRRADGLRQPLRAYAWVEGALALTTGAVGLLLFLGRDTLLVGGESHGLARGAVIFFFALALLLVPTLLMGATFPLRIAASRRVGLAVRGVSILSALHTLGASLGTLVCGFVLLPVLGVRASVAAGALLHLLAATACLPALLSSSEDAAPADAGPPETSAEPASLPRGLLLGVSATSGLLTLGAGVAWTRLSSYFLGNRVHALGLFLACVLLSLSGGAWLSAWLLRRFGHRLAELLGGALAVSAALLVGGSALTDGWIQHQAAAERALPASSGVFFLARVLQTLVLVGPMMLALGCLFPLSLTASRLLRSHSGRAAGLFSLVNTGGAVAGLLLAGFGWLPTVGVYRGLGYLVAVACVAAGGVFAVAVRERLPKLVGLAGVTGVFALVPLALPEELVTSEPNTRGVYRDEDRSGVFQVDALPNGWLRVTNNHTRLFSLGAPSTSYVQQLQGHLGMFFRPEARSAVVLGSGAGITAGTLGLYPQVERVDAVELLPALVEVADLFVPYNFAYHRNPRVRVVVDEGRHYLARSKDRFDLVSIHVPDPRLPGEASLFHADFYEIVKQHLTPGGVVLLHISGPERRLLLSTLGRSFKYVLLFPSYETNFNVVASNAPLVADPAKIDALAAQPAVREALQSIGFIAPPAVGRVFAKGLSREDIPRLFNDPEVVTDDRPLLEYSLRGDAAGLFVSNE